MNSFVESDGYVESDEKKIIYEDEITEGQYKSTSWSKEDGHNACYRFSGKFGTVIGTGDWNG